MQSNVSESSNSPPSYLSSNSPPPPFSAFPDQYRVGRYDVSLVSVGEIKAHLKVLGAFHRLRQAVESKTDGWAAHLDPKARWGVFVQIAVYRFALYIEAVKPHSISSPMVPPLDVAMVLHTYQLNPSRFHEDSIRSIPQLKKLTKIVLEQVASNLDGVSLKQIPRDADIKAWQSATGTSYNALTHFLETKGATIVDAKTKATFLVPWIDEQGTGYAQQRYVRQSPSGVSDSHESRGVYKLAQDMLELRLYRLDALAGTVASATEAPARTSDSPRAKIVREAITRQPSVMCSSSAQYLASAMSWSRAGAETLLSSALGRDRSSNILSCYTRGERFSLDLAMAVLRQGTFIDKMHSLGWLDPIRFTEDDSLLERCIAHYHAFLDLLSSTRSMFCVPTLDIDLAWHTHQLSPRYVDDTVMCLGRFCDHDDKVEENTLSTAFDVTARAWQSRFGVPYSTCGCLLPPQAPLSRLASKLNLSPNSSYPTAALSTLTPAEDDADATHASEHNSLVLPAHPGAIKLRKKRVAEQERRMAKAKKEEDKAAKKAEKRGEQDAYEAQYGEAGRRRDVHDAAFFYPIPLIPVYGPMGYPLPAGGNCCSSDGSTAGGNSGCSAAGASSGACASVGGASCGGLGASCASCGGSSGGGGCGGGGGGCGGGGCGGGGCGGS
ncbi:hypothetical protein JCM8097_001510 [Rhodosporidiobolus ruineniae]